MANLASVCSLFGVFEQVIGHYRYARKSPFAKRTIEQFGFIIAMDLIFVLIALCFRAEDFLLVTHATWKCFVLFDLRFWMILYTMIGQFACGIKLFVANTTPEVGSYICRMELQDVIVEKAL